MTNNPLPPANAEIVAKWREEHKEILLETKEYCLAHFQASKETGEYYDWKIEASWQGFLMARQSVVIDLNITSKTHPHINHCSTYGDALYDAKLHIEAQGYAVRRE